MTAFYGLSEIGMLGFGYVDPTPEQDFAHQREINKPARHARKRLREIPGEIAAKRALVAHAARLGYGFDSEYGSTPESDIDDLEHEQERLLFIGPRYDRHFKVMGKMLRERMDKMFDSSALLSMLRSKNAPDAP